MPHALVAATRILLQVAEVHGFNKDPRGFVDAASFPQIQGYGKVRGNVIAVLCFVHQSMHSLRLVLEELQVSTVEEGGAN